MTLQGAVIIQIASVPQAQLAHRPSIYCISLLTLYVCEAAVALACCTSVEILTEQGSEQLFARLEANRTISPALITPRFSSSVKLRPCSSSTGTVCYSVLHNKPGHRLQLNTVFPLKLLPGSWETTNPPHIAGVTRGDTH